MKSYALIPIVALFGLTHAFAQTPMGQPKNCPPVANPGPQGEKGKTGYEPDVKMPAEKSAILPAAPQNDQSAAPTVQQDGKAATADADCPKAPNKARS